MTIEERIEKSKRTPRKPAIQGFIDGFEGRIYMFSKSELHDLLEQVAKEQREICIKTFRNENLHDIAEWAIKEQILNAPSPLSHD